MKTVIRLFILSVILLFGITNYAYCQFTTKEVLFFSAPNDPRGDIGGINVIVINTDGTIAFQNTMYYRIKDNLYKSVNYYENLVITEYNGRIYKYCQELSTPRRVVYKRDAYVDVYPMCNGVPMMGMTPKKVLSTYEYIAIAIDKSSYIYWFEKANTYTEEIQKQYYNRIPKSEFIPKQIDHDFLND